MYKGKLFRIKIGGKTVFHETDFKFSSSKDFSEVASKDVNGKQFIPKDIEWSISCSSLVGDSADDAQVDATALYAMHLADDTVEMEFSPFEEGTMIFTGSAHVSQFDLDGTYDDTVKGSFSFKGENVPVLAEVPTA